ncbi:MAG: transpeptidase family protein [Flavipsychrobacter sp.]|nr:transpeptidase family protein [Flavipsychrobacter sp.]
MNIKKDIRFRVYVAFTCICLLGLAIIIKAATIQVKEGPELRRQAYEMHTRTAELPAERGNIYTEDGELLCSTIPQFDVHIDFSVISQKLYDANADSLAYCLSDLFKDKSKSEYKRMLDAAYKKKGRYVLLRRNMKYYDYQAVRSFPIFNKGKAYGGFIEDPKIKRVNPYQMLAYRTIGLWRENSQTIGLENKYDSILRGEAGRRIEQKAIGNIWVPLEGSEVETQNGRDIVTTLDIGIQEVAEYSLMHTLEEYKCEYGTCIVMEVATGKIRAIANLGLGKDGHYHENFNYALTPTEPGSTFKMMTLFSLFRDKHIKITDKVNTEGGSKIFYKRRMEDSHNVGEVTIRDAFAQSSNVAMAKLADHYYHSNPDKYIANLKKLHLHEKTGIDIPGERPPVLKTPKNKSWSATTLPWMATGYEVLVSPMRTCMVYNAVANNGKMMKPYLVSAIREYGKDVVTVAPTVVEEQIADEETIKSLRACAEEVVLTGTAKQYKSPFYTMAGKTGTAQVADMGITYGMGVYQGSFVGYVPADNPKYTIAVVVRTRRNSSAYYGGTIAAPVFKMIADRIFATGKTTWTKPVDSIASVTKVHIVAQKAPAASYRSIMNSMGIKFPLSVSDNLITQVSSDSNSRVVVTPQHVYTGVVPDVSGMGLKDAVYLLEQQGARVQVRGRGRVRSQSVAPGGKITKGQQIILQLS